MCVFFVCLCSSSAFTINGNTAREKQVRLENAALQILPFCRLGSTQTILDGKEVVKHRFEGDAARCVCFQRWMLYTDRFQLTIAHLTAQWIIGD